MVRVLVVDDRREARELIAEELAEAGFDAEMATNGEEGWRRFRTLPHDLVITDLRMPHADGLELLRRVRAASRVPVIVLTAYGDVPTAVAAMKGGATEFLAFPEELGRAVEHARRLVEPASHAVEGPLLSPVLGGRSAAIRRARSRVRALAPLPVPVLVRGEPGTGRDATVVSLHRLAQAASPERRDVALVTLRPDDPATSDRFTSGLTGFVYLDEVHRHPLEAQRRWAARLREEPKSGRPPLRLFASTSESLDALARGGLFDPDLARSLLRFPVVLPPVRERRKDFSELLAALLAAVGRRVGRPGIRLLPSARARLRRYAWPGNLRELAEVLERLVAFSSDGTIAGRAVEDVLGEAVESVESLRASRGRRERDELLALLRECGGNLAEVARRLHMSRSAIHYRVRKHGLRLGRRCGS